jgi:hypothetical protein
MLAIPACSSHRARDVENRRSLEPIVHQALDAVRDAFVRGDAEAALRASGLDTVHWPAVRAQADAAIRRRAFLLRHNHEYHAILEARTTVDSARLTRDTATLWVTGLSVYALRLFERDTRPGPSMGEAVPHVFSFARRQGTWVLVRDSIISDAELHRHARRDPAADSPTPRVSPTDTATGRYPGPTRDRRRTDEAARRRVRDRNAMEADIARGPVPGYAGVMMQAPCTFVVLLTDTLTQKAAVITATSVADPRVRGYASVTVWPGDHPSCEAPR